MILGQTIVADTVAGATYFSPWFPRGGNLLTISFQVTTASAHVDSLAVQIQTKNQDQADNSATDIGSSTSITLTAGTVTPVTAGANLDSGNQGLLELVRVKYVVKSDTADTLAAVHLRTLNPTWLSN